jgi:hypothetical protein
MRTVGDRNPTDPRDERAARHERLADQIYASYLKRLQDGDLDVADAVADYLRYDRADLLIEIIKLAIGTDSQLTGLRAYKAVRFALSTFADTEATNRMEDGE